MSSESDDRTKILDHTTVDLGDDLLKTQTLMRASPDADITAETRRPDAVADWIESAKILMSEGIFGEAKKDLRKVLVFDPTNSVAPKLLEQIQDIEIQRLLTEEGQSVFQRKRSGEDQRDIYEVFDQLVKDLHLEIEDRDEKAFPSPHVEVEFGKWVKSFTKGAKPKDFLDLGVALIQMQLYDYAVAQFQKAEEDIDIESQAKSLKAYALILGGNAFQGLLELDALIENNQVKNEDKIDWAYLSGRAHEELGNWLKAIEWYDTANEIDPGYRDNLERTKRCKKILSSSSSS